MIRDIDLLAVARELARDTNVEEAKVRSAVSRAYYAAYHRLLGVAQSRGYRYDRRCKRGSHVDLMQFLSEPANADLRAALNILRGMKVWRTEADYHLGICVVPERAKMAISRAQHILATTRAPDPT